MAIVLKFERGGTDYSLQDEDAGFQLKKDGWIPAIARPAYGFDPEDVEERISIRIEDSNHNNLAGEMQELHALQRWAAMYKHDRTEDTPVWLHAKLFNETGERRALVKSISGDFSTGWFGASAIGNKLEVPLSVVRAPYWERTAARDLPQWRPSAAAAYLYDYTAAGASVAAHNIVGDTDARIEQFNTYYVGQDIEYLWAGIRSVNKVATPANLVVLWEYENGSVELGSLTTDSTASPGGAGNTKLQIPSGTTTWTKAHRLELQDATSNYTDNFGNFLWLLRTKVSAGTWEVQFKFGYHPLPEDAYIEGRIVEVSETSWWYKDMGIQPIPLRNFKALPNVSFDDRYFEIETWVRQTSGSGTLDLDCVTPVPVDEGFFHTYDATTTSGHYLIMGETPEGSWEAAGFDPVGSYFQMCWPHEPVNFRLPPGDGRMVLVPMTGTGSTLSNAIRVNDADVGKYYERWDSLRGSE